MVAFYVCMRGTSLKRVNSYIFRGVIKGQTAWGFIEKPDTRAPRLIVFGAEVRHISGRLQSTEILLTVMPGLL